MTGQSTIISNLMIYQSDDADLKTMAKSFELECPGQNLACAASSADQVSKLLKFHHKIKQLIFYTHGNSGFVHFPGGRIDADNASVYLGGAPTLFDLDGRILLAGCRAAAGDDGWALLEAIGKAMLVRHGGIVGGMTSLNFAVRWGLVDMFTLWGNLRLVKFDVNGNPTMRKEV